MTSFALAPRRPTLADTFIERSFATDCVLIAAGAALTAIAAQFVIPLWPVPITAQSFAVLFLGSTLGALRGSLSMALYLIMGSFGLPIFAGGSSGAIIGSGSGGFILGFIFAAALTGWFAERNWDHRALRTLASFAVGTVTIYAIGLPWLYTVLSGYDPATLMHAFGTSDVLSATLEGGLTPFIVGDTIKIAVAAVVLPMIWKITDKRVTATSH